MSTHQNSTAPEEILVALEEMLREVEGAIDNVQALSVLPLSFSSVSADRELEN